MSSGRCWTQAPLGAPCSGEGPWAFLLMEISILPSCKRLYITIENHHFNGTTHYKWPFSIAMLVYQRILMFHGFNNVEFYDSLAASRCFGGAVLLGRPRFVEHVHAPCCRTSFISWLCLGKRNIHHDWGIQKRNLYESVLFCVILWGAQKSKQIQAI